MFMDGLKKWNSQATNLKTFSNFRKDIRQEYLDLQDVGGLTINNSIVNQTNMIQELKDHQVLMSNNMKEEFNANLMHTFRALNLISDNSDDVNYQMDKENVPQNKTQNDLMCAMKSHSDPAIDQLIQQVSFMQNAMQAFMSDNKQGRASDTNKGKNSRTDTINPKTGQAWKRYCWTCGCCTHWGKNCPNTKSGHKDEATFKNRMNGSNENCL